ncbi:MAG: hypothetical protein FJ291_09345 [Planctomycetes bacterium]|nr:hypothetical protein [Planctomycetota bacterium]
MSIVLEQLPMVDKVVPLALRITKEKGEFALFGLFLREDAPNRWDLVVSAPWLDRDRMGGMEYLARKLRSRLATDELVTVSGIVVLETQSQGVRDMQRWRAIRGTPQRLENVELFGLAIKEAYVAVCQDPRKNREALDVLAGQWSVTFPGGRESARIDAEGNYFVHDPRYGYSLWGDPKYVLQSVRYSAQTKTITFTKVKPDGSEAKPETLTVRSDTELVGYATGKPKHRLQYTRKDEG